MVKRCVHRKSGESYAVKVISTAKLTKRDFEKLEREARICQKLRHENIVRMHETCSGIMGDNFIFLDTPLGASSLSLEVIGVLCQIGCAETSFVDGRGNNDSAVLIGVVIFE